jgi:hypothetical protein
MFQYLLYVDRVAVANPPSLSYNILNYVIDGTPVMFRLRMAVRSLGWGMLRDAPVAC